ncbi:flagellar hook-associated protein 3 [Sinomonas halotolerans]|uniref:Flagellin n=1 Tax=Sinomonas halotolerans TaxID=1644133 RepID=A0ABU9WYS7_9MICC
MIRVTGQTMMLSAQRGLAASQGRLAELQERSHTLRRVEKASDDPVAAAGAMAVRAQQTASAQHARNIDDGRGWLTTVDSSLSAAEDILQRVRDLTVQGGGNGALNAQAREAMAIELDGLRSELLVRANTQYLGRSVFAGTSDAASAFAADGTFAGVPGTSVERRVGPGAPLRVDADGAAAFGSGAGSAFELIRAIAADLRAGVPTAGRIAEVDARLKAVLDAHADVGVRHAALEKAAAAQAEAAAHLEHRRANLEDADLSQTILDLKIQETSYQAALAVTAKALPQSLLDFLR